MSPDPAARPSPAAHPGYRATVSALAVGQIVQWAALYYGFSSFVLPMQRELGWDKTTIMGAYTFGLALWGLSAYAVGVAIDRGHGRAVMTWGSALGGLGLLAWSQVSAPWMLYAVWAWLGVTMSMTLYEPAFNVLTKRYPDRYRQGITTLTLVGGLASTLSFPAALALQAWLGWRGALAVGGMAVLLMAPLHRWALRGPALVAGPAHEDPAADATLHQALRESTFWLLTICFTLYSFCQAAMWAHVMPAFVAKGLSEAEAMSVLVWVGPAQVLGRLAYAWRGAGWSLRVLGSIVMAGLPLSMAIFALSDSWLGLAAFALLFGAANGLVTIVRGALIPAVFGRSHVGRIGGTMSAFGLVARAAAPLSAAAALAWLAGYRELLLGLSALGTFGAVAFWLARPRRSSSPSTL